MTNYIILVKHPSEELELWIQATAITARSARSAIRQAVEGADNPYKDGTFVAVPARSWRPVTVEVETKTALKFS